MYIHVYIYIYILEQEHLHLWTDVSPPSIDLYAEGDHRQHSWHLQQHIPHVVGEVGGGKSDGDLNHCIIEDTRQPPDGQSGHDVSKHWPSQSHTQQVQEDVQTCNSSKCIMRSDLCM